MTDTELQNVRMVEQLNELVNTRNYQAMPALFAVNYIDNNPGWKIDSVEGLIEVIRGAADAFDIQNEIVETIAAGDKVFVHIKNNGTHKNTAFGIAPTGKPTVMTTFEIYRFEAGKIAERWVVSDVMSLANQLGAKLPFQQEG